MAQLIKRGDLWYSDYRQNGKRIRRALSIYKPEASRLLKEMVAQRQSERSGSVVRDMSWPYFRDTILSESETSQNKKTYYANRRAFKLIDSVTHLTHVRQMTPDRLARVKVDLLKAGIPASAVARAIRGMMTMMRIAEDRKYVAMQNWRTVKVKEPAGRIDYYEQDAYLKLLAGLDGDWFTSALVMGRAGLRLGEMLHLEWKDIQLDQRRILFRSKPELGWTIKKDMELNKIRTIPMLTSDLRQHLERIRRPSGFVLSDKVSRRLDVYGRQLTSALEATKVRTEQGELGHPHLLRHTFGSHMAQLGIDLNEIRGWMGHESVRMTQCYAHLKPGSVSRDPAVFEKLGSACPVSENGAKKLGSALVPVPSGIGPDRMVLDQYNADLVGAEMSTKRDKSVL
jgi:integrase